MNRLSSTSTGLAALCTLTLLTACAGPGGAGGVEPGGTPTDPAAHVREGDRAAAKGELDRALAQYAIALEKDADDAELYYKIAFIHQSQGRTELAERGLREALARAPEHVPARVSLGLIALRRENYRYAELIMAEVLERDRHNWRALNALGVIHDLKDEFDAAGDFYDRALARVPDSVDVLNNLGYSLYLQGRLEEARRRFERVVSIDPEHAHGWSNLALVYLRLGDEDLAKMAFRNVVEEHQALNNIGYFDLLREERRSAREKFRDAVRAAPSYYALAYRNLASLEASAERAQR